MIDQNYFELNITSLGFISFELFNKLLKTQNSRNSPIQIILS